MKSRRRKQSDKGMQRAQYALLDIQNVQSTSLHHRENEEQDEPVLLAASIARHGLLEPILVRRSPQPGQYLLVSGARRLQACRVAGVSQVHAMVLEGDEWEAAACWLEGHMTRRQPSCMSEAEAICCAGADMVLRRFALPRKDLEARLQLLALPLSVRELAKRQGLTLEQVKPLLEIQSEQKQLEAAGVIAQRKLSGGQAQRLVRGPGERESSSGQSMSAAIAELERTIRSLQSRGFQVQVGMYSQDDGVCIQIHLKKLSIFKRSAGNSCEKAN